MKIVYLNSKIVVFFVVFVLGYTSPYSATADYKMPTADMMPADVLIVQLEALKNNDTPFADFGIRQTYTFAHPENKARTGPVQRFKKMLYGQYYKVLINHKAHSFNLISNSQSSATYKVTIIDANDKNFDFIWNITKYTAAGLLQNCWLTLSVSIPLRNSNSI